MLEVRYAHSLPNTAGALTKTIKTGARLFQLVQKSQHNLPRGTFVKESKLSSGSRRFAICEEHEKLIYIAPKTNLRDCRRFLVVKDVVDGILY